MTGIMHSLKTYTDCIEMHRNSAEDVEMLLPSLSFCQDISQERYLLEKAGYFVKTVMGNYDICMTRVV